MTKTLGIKNWKKVTDNSQQISWENEKNGGFATISCRFKVSDIKKWAVFAEEMYPRKAVVKYPPLLTKQEAIKLVVKYMKSRI